MPTHHSPKTGDLTAIKSPNESIINIHEDDDNQGASGFHDTYADLNSSDINVISGQCQMSTNPGYNRDDEMIALRNRLATTERQLSEANSLINREANRFQFPPRQSESVTNNTAVVANTSATGSLRLSTMPPVAPGNQAAYVPNPAQASQPQGAASSMTIKFPMDTATTTWLEFYS